jgi:cytidylate kinase
LRITLESPVSKPISSLTPGVEQRLAGWTSIQERIAQHQDLRIRPTITLSRQFGCEAFPLASRLKQLVEDASGEPWMVYDKSLIEKVAKDENISLRLLKNLGDTSRAIESLGLTPVGYVTHDEAFDKIARYIIQVAQVGNAIIVGRGGAILCKEMKNCYHFRLEAGFPFRVASIIKRLELPMKEAENLVKENSKIRDKFISKCLGANVGDLAHYDAVFNNERHTVNDMASAILAYIKEDWADKHFFKV